MALTVVHAADLHLDSPMRGLARYEGSPVQAVRQATRGALENLIDLCLEREASLLLLAGDIYDGEWRDYATGMFFVRQLRRLESLGCRTVIVRGNHDAQSKVTKHLRFPSLVHELAARRPETLRFGELGIAVHGQSYAEQKTTADLAQGYPAAVPGAVNFGLLHTCATGRPGHAPYAPCSIETLRDKGYHYWALGHVHQREVLSEDPWIVFPGNLQGRHVNESGAKGAMVIEVAEGGIQTVEFAPLDTVRWFRLAVDAGEALSPDDALDAGLAALTEAADQAQPRLVAVRVELEVPPAVRGPWLNDVDGWEARLRSEAQGVGDIWLEKVVVRASAASAAPLSADAADAVAGLRHFLRELPRDDAALAELVPLLKPVQKKLPPELKRSGHWSAPEDVVRAMLPDVEALLVERLRGGDPT